MNIYIQAFKIYVITHACHDINGDLTKQPLNRGASVTN